MYYAGWALYAYGTGLCVLETDGARPTAGTVMETISHILFYKIHIRRWDNFQVINEILSLFPVSVLTGFIHIMNTFNSLLKQQL